MRNYTIMNMAEMIHTDIRDNVRVRGHARSTFAFFRALSPITKSDAGKFGGNGPSEVSENAVVLADVSLDTFVDYCRLMVSVNGQMRF